QREKRTRSAWLTPASRRILNTPQEGQLAETVPCDTIVSIVNNQASPFLLHVSVAARSGTANVLVPEPLQGIELLKRLARRQRVGVDGVERRPQRVGWARRLRS